jgi:hypothetical protein
MLNKLLMAVCCSLIAMASKADEGQKINSKVQKVVVFLSGAQVRRTAAVSIKQGTSTLVFNNLSPDIDAQSIQVHSNGAFTILSVKHEMDYVNEQAKQTQVEDLRAKQKALKDKITFESNFITIYEEEANLLRKNQTVSGENTGLDVVKLKQALDFQTERFTEIKKKEQAINNEVEELNAELLKYDKQINDIAKGTTTATSNILVTISSKTALEAEFTISYVVHSASWFPTYDIRAKDVNSPIRISYKANVSQHCGEEWKNIRLTLSTGNPSVSGSKPELNPYYLGYGMYYVNPAGSPSTVSGKVVGSDDNLPITGATIKIAGTSIGTTTDANGNYSLQLPHDAQNLVCSFIGYGVQTVPINSGYASFRLVPSASSLNEVVVTGYGTVRKTDATGSVSTINADKLLYGQAAGVTVGGTSSYHEEKTTIPIAVNQVENQTNIEFDITDPYTITNDGKQCTVEINDFDLKAIYQYAVVPKVSTDVFLTAKLTDWNKYNFLSGEANLFFEGTFIGKSVIDANATADTLNLSLGADKNIVVTRTSIKSLMEKQSLGSNRKETRDWQIEAKNRKNQAVNLLVEDQVPVSQNSGIDVEKEELSGGKFDEKTGKVSWDFQLSPQDDKKVELKYMVKYPKNQSVIVQ